MKTYYIYNEQTEAYIGEVEASSIEEAEYKAAGKFTDYGSAEMYALSEKREG